LKAIQNMKMKR